MGGRVDDVSDDALAERARDGDTEAYGELWRRHAHAGLASARQFQSIAEPEDIVSEAFARILRALHRDGGPRAGFRPYLYRTVRNVALEWGRSAPPLDTVNPDAVDEIVVEPETSALESMVVMQAFRRLPERWRTVLWYTEIEGMEPAEAAPHLGLSANSAAALAYRARDGLKKAWLQEHVGDVTRSRECQWAASHMGSYVRGSLSRAKLERFDRHLDSCAHCADLVDELNDLGRKLASVILPITIGGAAAAAVALRERDATTTLDAAAVGRRSGISERTAAVASVVLAAMAITSAFAIPVLPFSMAPDSAAVDDVAAPVVAPPPDSTARPAEVPAPDDDDAPEQPSTTPPRPAPIAAPRPAPLPPVVLWPADGTLTNEARPVFSGTGTPGARVSAWFAGSGAVSATVGTGGHWQLTPSNPLPDGVWNLGFTQIDRAGTHSSTTTITLAIDTIALAPVIDALPADLVFLPELSGLAEPGASVTVLIEGAPVAEVSANGDGVWSTPLPDPGEDAGVAITAQQVDRAGNVSPESDPMPPLNFVRPWFAAPAEGAVLPSQGGATVVALQLAGEPGWRVEVLINGVATGNIHTLEADPLVRLTPALADGSHTIGLRYIDPGTGRVGSLHHITFTIAS
ncbi:MAG: sigma-70 family RNA polymerase sigma factor [Microcella sp.]|uniref:sigma-70 family RNA polymerase sigma factor n=1 Tax=Microcella sp. TaxID=1913979 RepID=UPI0024CAB081|nr:sigma-70 family RNA polymerase sigma factor [Microcella sp.]UYN82775.1 MAG: sigma-70 family RNA polymerase sigma factor [Microcella sp.]